MINLLIIGTNDIASACAVRLFRAGFGVCMVGQKITYDLFGHHNFSPVLKHGSKLIENVKAISFSDYLYHSQSEIDLSINNFISFTIQNREIAVIAANDLKKANLMKMAYCVNCEDVLFISLDLKFDKTIISCGREETLHSDYFIETVGLLKGRVRYPFNEMKNVAENSDDIFSIFSTCEGVFVSNKSPGDPVNKNEKIGSVGETDLFSGFSGFVRGMVAAGLIVGEDIEVFRLSRKSQPADVTVLPADSYSVAGGVLEAILIEKSSTAQEK
jgi:hypothetical protein